MSGIWTGYVYLRIFSHRRDIKAEIRNLKFEIRNLKFEIRNSKFEIRNYRNHHGYGGSTINDSPQSGHSFTSGLTS